MPYDCDKGCVGLKFSTRRGLNAHVVQKHRNEPTKSTENTTASTSPTSSTSTAPRNSGGSSKTSQQKSPECDVCGFKTGSEALLKDHSRVHIKATKPYACRKGCTKYYYRNRTSMITHYSSVHGCSTKYAVHLANEDEQNVNPPITPAAAERAANRVAADINVAKAYVQIQRPTTKRKLEECADAVKELVSEQKRQSMLYKVNKCATCGANFSNVTELQQHQDMHNPRGKPYQCRLSACKQMFFTSREGILMHYRAVHQFVGAEPQRLVQLDETLHKRRTAQQPSSRPSLSTMLPSLLDVDAPTAAAAVSPSAGDSSSTVSPSSSAAASTSPSATATTTTPSTSKSTVNAPATRRAAAIAKARSVLSASRSAESKSTGAVDKTAPSGKVKSPKRESPMDDDMADDVTTIDDTESDASVSPTKKRRSNGAAAATTAAPATSKTTETADATKTAAATPTPPPPPPPTVAPPPPAPPAPQQTAPQTEEIVIDDPPQKSIKKAEADVPISRVRPGANQLFDTAIALYERDDYTRARNLFVSYFHWLSSSHSIAEADSEALRRFIIACNASIVANDRSASHDDRLFGHIYSAIALRGISDILPTLYSSALSEMCKFIVTGTGNVPLSFAEQTCWAALSELHKPSDNIARGIVEELRRKLETQEDSSADEAKFAAWSVPRELLHSQAMSRFCSATLRPLAPGDGRYRCNLCKAVYSATAVANKSVMADLCQVCNMGVVEKCKEV